MSNRLNQEREEKLQPSPMAKAIIELEKMEIKLEYQDDVEIWFYWKGSRIMFYPYSGWHQCKGIKPGRGLQNLLKQLTD